MKITKILSLFLVLVSSPAFAFGFLDLGIRKNKSPHVQPAVPVEMEMEGTVVQMQSFADEHQNPKSCQALFFSTSLQDVRLTSSDSFTQPGQDGFEPALARETLACRALHRSLSQNKALKITGKVTPTTTPNQWAPSSLEFRTDINVMNAAPAPVDNITCIGNQCVAKGLLSKIAYPQNKSAPLCTASLKVTNAAGQAMESQIAVRIPTAFGIEWRWMQPDQARQALNAKLALCELLTAAQDANLTVSVTGTGSESNLNLTSAIVGDATESAVPPTAP